MSGRAVPFFCPYCGEETLVPDLPEGASGEGHGHWACRSCRRSFRLNLTALASAATTSAPNSSTRGAGETGPNTSGKTGPNTSGKTGPTASKENG